MGEYGWSEEILFLFFIQLVTKNERENEKKMIRVTSLSLENERSFDYDLSSDNYDSNFGNDDSSSDDAIWTPVVFKFGVFFIYFRIDSFYLVFGFI